MLPADPNQLTRTEIKGAFRRNRGAKAQLARDLDVWPQNISDWMRGIVRSKRIDAAIRQRAAELLNAERAATRREGA